MCGLAAIFAYGAAAPDVDGNMLSAINGAMARRGPDGQGQWLSDDHKIGLAHRRLAIIDLSDSAAQPMFKGDGKDRLAISYNGEIYNFLELRQRLEAENYAFTTNSDTEVLLQLYRRYGTDMVDHLRGMYAFAIWDEERGGLFLGRDPFGIKPLYYSNDGKTIAVASQVKALLAGIAAAGIPRPAFDAAGHVGFFMFGYVPEPHTLYDGISALPAGTTMWIDKNGPQPKHKFFDVSRRLADATDQTSDGPPPGTPWRTLADLLRDSVRHHFVSDVPVGVFLSAGLDSASITGLASEIKGANLDTLTLGFDEFKGSAQDEVPLAEDIAAHYGTRHHTVRVAGADFAGDIDDLLEAMDQPSIDGVNTYFVAKAAKQAGLKVALSGLGGDELLCGYDGFTQIPKLVSALGWLPGRSILGRGLRAVLSLFSGLGFPPKAAGLIEYGGAYGEAYLLRRSLFMPWELESELRGVMSPEMIKRGLKDLKATQRLDQCQRDIVGGKRKVSALETNWYMRNQLLRDADWAGMAHGVEIRVPLVDPVLFEGLAGRIGTEDGPDKQAMARTLKTALPGAVLGKPKTGFSVPVRDWLEGGDAAPAGRGLRDWAKRVYAAQIA